MRQLRVGIFLATLVVAVAAAGLLLRPPAPDEPRVVINGTAVPPVPTGNPQRITQGAALYATYCAECHGANLEGAPDWKRRLPDGSLPPPPHDRTGHTWHHPDALLLRIITGGGDPAFNSRMPAFNDKLTEDEMVAILEFIKGRWGKDEREFQWWMTAVGGGP